MKDFYVELISNGSYAENTVSNFKNKINLLQPLDGEWEAGLTEISYTKSWYNIPEDTIIEISKEKDIIAGSHDTILVKLKRGYYEDAQKLVDEINREIKTYTKSHIKVFPELYYDNISTKQIYIKPGRDDANNILVPVFASDLRELLGFEYYDKIQKDSKGYYTSARPPDMSMGIRQLLVYCDLILPQYVGDSRTKLLRSVEIPNNLKFGDQITLNYEKPHYVPILTNEFDEIEINIKDDVNEDIKFTFGRSRVKLHFRKI